MGVCGTQGTASTVTTALAAKESQSQRRSVPLGGSHKHFPGRLHQGTQCRQCLWDDTGKAQVCRLPVYKALPGVKWDERGKFKLQGTPHPMPLCPSSQTPRIFSLDWMVSKKYSSGQDEAMYSTIGGLIHCFRSSRPSGHGFAFWFLAVGPTNIRREFVHNLSQHRSLRVGS